MLPCLLKNTMQIRYSGRIFVLTHLVYSYKLIIRFMIINQQEEFTIMENFKLCESDYRFMLVVWENEPVASGQLVKLCAEKLGWKKPTTYTVIRKMCEKGLLKNENTIVSTLVPKEQVQAYETERFVEHAFEGSLPHFLTSFLSGKTISEKEADELKRLIDAHKFHKED